MHANDFADAIRNVFSDAKEGKNVNKMSIAGGHDRNSCSLYKTEEANKIIQIFRVYSQNVP
jgi:hypothetical protein